MADVPEIAKSWKAWGAVVAAIIGTIVLIEKAQPYIEAYSTQKTETQIQSLHVSQLEMKKEILAILDVMRDDIQEMKTKVDKDLILATIEAVRKAELPRTE